MKEYKYVYEENKKLDVIFDELYDSNNREIIEKNILELLVELGELANETRCFKYWSTKKINNKEEILEEYADCMIMALYFCNMVKIDIDGVVVDYSERDIIIQFIKLYGLVSKLKYVLDKNLIQEIISNLVNLGNLLCFSDKEIIEGCLKKIEKNKLRFETGF